MAQAAHQIVLNLDKMPVVLYRNPSLVDSASGLVRIINQRVLRGQFDGRLKPCRISVGWSACEQEMNCWRFVYLPATFVGYMLLGSFWWHRRSI